MRRAVIQKTHRVARINPTADLHPARVGPQSRAPRRLIARAEHDLMNLIVYCVRSIQMDPVFLCLVQDYRTSPTVAKAVALYDLFCVPNGLARLSTQEVIPPMNLRIQSAIRPFREHWTRTQV